MSFAKLYRYVAGLNEYPIRIEGVVDAQVKVLTGQDELHYVAVDLDPEISLGHIKQYRYPKVVYDHDPVWVTEIRYYRDLDLAWQRYVCCKELMHAFDTAEERTNDPGKLEQLLTEIETPLPVDLSSPMYRTENRAKWMAALVLCPGPLRDHFKERYDRDDLSEYEIALELQIPEALIASIMSDRYERVFESLVGGDAADQLELRA